MRFMDILLHSIGWSCRDQDAPDTLDEASVEHIRTCIMRGFREGELHVRSGDGAEYLGWWTIAQGEGSQVAELEARVDQISAELNAIRNERDALVAQVALASTKEPDFWANAGVLSVLRLMDEGAVCLSTRPTQDMDVALYTSKPILDPAKSREQCITWPNGRHVGRIGDMAPRGHSHMQVSLDADNDVCVQIWEQDREDGQVAGIEFCCPGVGGGKSPRTREALLGLMVAMEDDNMSEPRGAFPLEGRS